MDACNKSLTRRERRRRQNEEKFESDIDKQWKFAAEIISEKQKDFRMLIQRDTFPVSKNETVFHTCISGDEGGDKKVEESYSDIMQADLMLESDSDASKYITHTINGGTISNTDSKNLTYSLYEDDDDRSISKHDIYNVQNNKTDLVRPIPAPRKHHPAMMKEIDKQSSDTDKDILEIEIDEVRENEKNSDEILTKKSSSEDLVKLDIPKPKPRNLTSGCSLRNSFIDTDLVAKSKSLEELTIGRLSPRSAQSNPETKHRYSVRSEVQEEVEGEDSPVLQTKEKKRRKIFDLIYQRKKSSKRLSSVMKLEKARISTISSILKDLKVDGSKSKLEEEYKKDFHLDSPHLPQSQQNDKMYVQRKNGFYVKSRKDVLRQDEGFISKGETGMEDSTMSKMLRTALLFQKYWSRSMIYFHGVLAGFGFCHAFTISAIMFYFNYEFQGFINIYAFLALKIHFIFYTLIALCIISCLDRLDIGHLKMNHWAYVCIKCPSSWLILFMYLISFILTFVNHTMEFRFDGHQYVNVTGEMLQGPEIYNNIPEAFSFWYRLVWARDMIVLAAWSLISLTEFEDNLYLYVVQLSKNLKSNKENSNRITLTVNS